MDYRYMDHGAGASGMAMTTIYIPDSREEDKRTMMKFESIFEEAVSATENLLHGAGNESDYIASIREVTAEIIKCTDEEIGKLPYEEAVIRGIKTDRGLLKSVIKAESDQASLVATLVTYKYSRDRGLPNHSGEYMRWVSELRDVIERHYQTKAETFC